MEMIGGDNRERTVYGTAHWDVNDAHTSDGGNYSLPQGNFAQQFHVFSIVWTSQRITWYVDDVRYHEVDIASADRDEFQKEFFLLLNVAVGGSWPGSPAASTQFPQQMIVDYVRVFQNL
jgi:beta-glucanase (GH16 family)